MHKNPHTDCQICTRERKRDLSLMFQKVVPLRFAIIAVRLRGVSIRWERRETRERGERRKIREVKEGNGESSLMELITSDKYGNNEATAILVTKRAPCSALVITMPRHIVFEGPDIFYLTRLMYTGNSCLEIPSMCLDITFSPPLSL